MRIKYFQGVEKGYIGNKWVNSDNFYGLREGVHTCVNTQKVILTFLLGGKVRENLCGVFAVVKR